MNKEENCKETFEPLSFDKDILAHCSEDNYASSLKYSNISICMKADKTDLFGCERGYCAVVSSCEREKMLSVSCLAKYVLTNFYETLYPADI